MTGIELIAAERRRQVETEGFSAEHDDQHEAGELAWAAVCYAAPTRVYTMAPIYEHGVVFNDPWPDVWTAQWDKRPRRQGELRDNQELPPATRIRQLVKAGALIAAELDRLLRRQEDRGRRRDHGRE